MTTTFEEADPPLEYCGIRVRREAPHFSRGQIAVGHQWIEFLDEFHQVIFSAGFWPSRGGSIWRCLGQVASPDPHGGQVNRVTSRPIWRRPGYEPSCGDIRTCIEARVAIDEADPPVYALIWHNCRNWSKNVLRGCFLTL